MRCKQCGEPFSKSDSHDVWEFKRQHVQPDPTANAATVHVEDAGTFCSRGCLKDYLGAGERSGVFSLRKPLA